MAIAADSWVLYIVQCNDGTLYTGITTDIERRLHEHNHSHKAAKYTRSRRPVKLVYQAACKSRAEAASSEYRIRHLARSEKLRLISHYLAEKANGADLAYKNPTQRRTARKDKERER